MVFHSPSSPMVTNPLITTPQTAPNVFSPYNILKFLPNTLSLFTRQDVSTGRVPPIIVVGTSSDRNDVIPRITVPVTMLSPLISYAYRYIGTQVAKSRGTSRAEHATSNSRTAYILRASSRRSTNLPKRKL